MLKRFTLLLAVAMLVVSVFTACGTTVTKTGETSTAVVSTTSENSTAQDSTTPQNPEYINLMTPWQLPQGILDQFKAKTGIEVKMDVIPNSGTDYKQTRNARMAAGSEMDIIGADGADVSDFAHKGTVVELTNESWMKNFDPSAVIKMSAQSQTPGKQYWAVYEAMTVGVWYNKDIFKKYNLEVPKSYDDFVSVCDILKKNEVTPLVQGGKDQWPLEQEQQMFLLPLEMKNINFFPDLMSGKVKFTDEDVTQLSKRLDVFNPQKGYYVKGTLSTPYDQAFQLLLQHKAAMWFMGSWGSEVIIKSNVKPDFEIGVFAIPAQNKGEAQYTSHILSRNYGVLSDSKKIDAAKQFLAFMTQPDIAKIYADNGMTISTVNGVTSDTMAAGEDWKKVFSLQDVPDPNMLDQNGNTYTMPEYNKSKDLVLAKIVAGQLTTDQYCAEMQKLIDKDIKALK